MGIFSKKNKAEEQEEFFRLEELSEPEVSQNEPYQVPYALTSDEILNSTVDSHAEPEKTDGPDPLEEMRNRMIRSAQKRTDDTAAPAVQTPADVSAAPEVSGQTAHEDSEKVFEELADGLNAAKSEPAASPEIKDPAIAALELTELSLALEQMNPERGRIETGPEPTDEPDDLPQTAPDEPIVPANPSSSVPRTVLPPKYESPASGTNDGTLLKRCKPFVMDDNGNDVSKNEKPLYELESVADILRNESERTLEKLSKKYDFTTEIQLFHDEPEKPEPNAEMEMFDEDPAESERPVLSDLDAVVLPDTDTADAPQDTATIRFTPVIKADGNTDHIRVSTMTRAVDLTGEIGEMAMPQEKAGEPARLQQTEFEEFSPSLDDSRPEDAKKLMRRLALQKRNAFLRLAGSIVLALLSLLFLLPFDTLITNPKAALIFATAVLGLQTVLNADMFKALKKAFNRRASTDCMTAALSASGLLLGVFAILKNTNTAYHCYALMATVSVLLFLRALGTFLSASAKAGNFRVIASTTQKNAVMLLEDPATTFAMANNAVEGQALVAAPRPAKMLENYMKYFEFSTVLDGRLVWVFGAALALATIVGVAVWAKLQGAVYGFYAATGVLCIAAAPPLFLMDVLPVYHAAARLNKKGAMIAGREAAERLDNVNAIVLSSRELFPDGTVTLHDMRVLEDNNIDEILVRASVLTEAVKSPLSAIFKQITTGGSNYKLPDSDSVKYEERLGLSGWVDDELLFVGNRTLMEAHGVAMPEIEVDRKILREGYFPVYIACGGKACALLTVQYRADERVASEIRSLTDLGVVLLVDSCDPNMTADMICDYLGLYEDSIRVMSSSGTHAYKNTVTPVNRQSAPAAFRKDPLLLASIINCAAKIRRSNLILTILYTLVACIGSVLFIYLTFTGSGLPNGKTLLLCAAVSWIVSYIAYLFKKP